MWYHNQTAPCSLDEAHKRLKIVDGQLFWRNPKGKQKRTALGWVNNSSSRQYLRFNINGRKPRVHVMVWFMETGQWPTEDIHHVNDDTFDNRIENLAHLSRKEHRQQHAA